MFLARTGERLSEMRRVIEQELRRSFSDSPSVVVVEPVDSCQTLFTANIERSSVQTDDEYQLGQVCDILSISVSLCMFAE